jgi:hypothetical protein
MNTPSRDAVLMSALLQICKEMFERLCIDLAGNEKQLNSLLHAVQSGEFTFQVLTTFDELPVIQGLLVDPTGNKVELFRLQAEGAVRLH